jgi:hypothetical protein
MKLFETPRNCVHLPKNSNKLHDSLFNNAMFPDLVRLQFREKSDADGLHYNHTISPNYALSKARLFESPIEYILKNLEEIHLCKIGKAEFNPEFYRCFEAFGEHYIVDMFGQVYYQPTYIYGGEYVYTGEWVKKAFVKRNKKITNSYRLGNREYNRDKLLISFFYGFEYFYHYHDLAKYISPRISLKVNPSLKHLPRLAQLHINIIETEHSTSDV